MTEIYGTLGPACANEEILEQMIGAGMTGVRLNLSHLSLPQAEGELAALREAERRSGKRVKLLIDMQGPELRIGTLSEPMALPEGGTISLERIPLPEVLRKRLRPGQELLLDDGKLLLRTEEKGKARILRGGILHSRKSVAVPGLELRLPALTESDRANLRLAADCGVYGVMQPFVRSREDLEELRRALNASGGAQIRIYAKIENREGIRRLEDLLPAADEIVIARGDLGNAMPLWELPAAQKEISDRCRAAGRAFMVVTQMLASMEHSPVPTRAEVSDIFHAVLSGAASVMATGETAVGDYPVEAIRYLANTVREAERVLTE